MVRLDDAKAETLWAVKRFKDVMTPEELVQTIYEGPMMRRITDVVAHADKPMSEIDEWNYMQMTS